MLENLTYEQLLNNLGLPTGASEDILTELRTWFLAGRGNETLRDAIVGETMGGNHNLIDAMLGTCFDVKTMVPGSEVRHEVTFIAAELPGQVFEVENKTRLLANTLGINDVWFYPAFGATVLLRLHVALFNVPGVGDNVPCLVHHTDPSLLVKLTTTGGEVELLSVTLSEAHQATDVKFISAGDVPVRHFENRIQVTPATRILASGATPDVSRKLLPNRYHWASSSCDYSWEVSTDGTISYTGKETIHGRTTIVTATGATSSMKLSDTHESQNIEITAVQSGELTTLCSVGLSSDINVVAHTGRLVVNREVVVDFRIDIGKRHTITGTPADTYYDTRMYDNLKDSVYIRRTESYHGSAYITDMLDLYEVATSRAYGNVAVEAHTRSLVDMFGALSRWFTGRFRNSPVELLSRYAPPSSPDRVGFEDSAATMVFACRNAGLTKKQCKNLPDLSQMTYDDIVLMVEDQVWSNTIIPIDGYIPVDVKDTRMIRVLDNAGGFGRGSRWSWSSLAANAPEVGYRRLAVATDHALFGVVLNYALVHAAHTTGHNYTTVDDYRMWLSETLRRRLRADRRTKLAYDF